MTTETNHKLTTDEAVKMIRTSPAKSKFYVFVRAPAPIVDSEDQGFADGCHGALQISKVDALKLLATFLPAKLQERGGRIPMSVSPNVCSDGNQYWIG